VRIPVWAAIAQKAAAGLDIQHSANGKFSPFVVNPKRNAFCRKPDDDIVGIGLPARVMVYKRIPPAAAFRLLVGDDPSLADQGDVIVAYTYANARFVIGIQALFLIAPNVRGKIQFK